MENTQFSSNGNILKIVVNPKIIIWDDKKYRKVSV